MIKRSPFRYFKASPEIIRLAVMLYVRFPLSLRNVEDLLHERGIDVSHETIRFWWNKFGPMFAAEIRRKRVNRLRCYSNWRWHLDEAFVKINGERHYLWRAVDHEGEVLESIVTKRRDKVAALKFMKKAMKRYGSPEVIVTDKLRSYGAAMKVIGNVTKQETVRWKIIEPRILTYLFVECEACRNLFPSMHPFLTTSIRSVAFPEEIISR